MQIRKPMKQLARFFSLGIHFFVVSLMVSEGIKHIRIAGIKKYQYRSMGHLADSFCVRGSDLPDK